MLVTWQRMTLSVIEDECCVWITDVVERDVAMQVRIQRSDYIIVSQDEP